MDVIRAPWRMEYIDSTKEDKEEECIFCRYPKEMKDIENLLIARGRFTFVMLNRFPYSCGHLMIVPYRHTSDITSLTQEESTEIFFFIQKSCETLQRAMKTDGMNIGMNIGKVAGAGIDTHLHVHVVPRWNGDTNFMSVTAETKVLPERLSRTREKLWKTWKTSKLQ